MGEKVPSRRVALRGGHVRDLPIRPHRDGPSSDTLVAAGRTRTSTEEPHALGIFAAN